MQVVNFIFVLALAAWRSVETSLVYAPASGHPRNVLWFGGPRGGEPDSYQYDLIYDDEASCKGELKAPSIRHYILMGSIIDAAPAGTSQECAERCFDSEQCASANYYHSTKALAGQCELLLEKQSDNPRWMLRMPGAVYMEVFCDYQEPELEPEQPEATTTKTVTLPHPVAVKKTNFLKDLVSKLKYFNRA